jgi:hypothetical protein
MTWVRIACFLLAAVSFVAAAYVAGLSGLCDQTTCGDSAGSTEAILLIIGGVVSVLGIVLTVIQKRGR